MAYKRLNTSVGVSCLSRRTEAGGVMNHYDGHTKYADTSTKHSRLCKCLLLLRMAFGAKIGNCWNELAMRMDCSTKKCIEFIQRHQHYLATICAYVKSTKDLIQNYLKVFHSKLMFGLHP